MPKTKLNYFSPLPPIKSGISDYSEELLKELQKYFDINAYVDEKSKKIGYIRIKNYKKFKINDDPIIYNIGNSNHHDYIYNLLLKKPGIVILHDLNLHGLNYSMMNKYWRKSRLLFEAFLMNGMPAFINHIKFFYYKNKKYLEVYSKFKKDKSKSSVLKWGWHQLEKGSPSFRWTKKMAVFFINDKIKELMLRVYTEFPAVLTIIINDKIKKIFKLQVDKYQWVKLKLDELDGIKVKLIISKPLGIISKLKDPRFREMGVRVAKIRYKTKNNYKEISLIENEIESEAINTLLKDKKFLDLKEKMSGYQLNKKIIKSARAIITHSHHAADIAKKINPKIPVKVINHGVYALKPNISKTKIRKKLNLEYNFIVCSFGKIQKHKNLEIALKSFKKFSNNNQKSVYILIGEQDESINIKDIINKYNLENKVIITGYLPFKKAIKYVYASDVCINLRGPTTGATSGSLIKSLSMGVPCIISDLPENDQFPDKLQYRCVFKIKKDNKETINILKVLNKLKNPYLREKMSSNAIKYIKENHFWKNKAKEIREFINEVYNNENSNN